MKKTIGLLLVCATAACGGYGYITNLPLSWRGIDHGPRATTAVDKAFAAVRLDVPTFKDSRADRRAVGVYEDEHFIVRTTDNVAGFATKHFRDMLSSSGARLDGTPGARVEGELLEFSVVEGGMFEGTARIRITVVRGGNAEPWSKVYEGKSKRWGRTHNPDNFNEALSNVLAEVTRRVIQDEAFAKALLGEAAGSASPTAPTPGAPHAPAPSSGAPGTVSL